MIIRAIKVEPAVIIKIFEKHSVRQEEVYQLFAEGKPQFRRVGGDQYIAIGLAKSRYVTVFFRYDARTQEAEITTAYPSDKKQTKTYKRMRP